MPDWLTREDSRGFHLLDYLVLIGFHALVFLVVFLRN